MICLIISFLQEQLDATCAWHILRSADHFHQKDICQIAMEVIFTKAEEALKQRPMVSDALLEDVLSSKSLCISNQALFSLLSKWDDLDESELNKVALIRKYVSIADISDGIIRSSGMSDQERQSLKGLKSVRSQNTEHTTNLFNTLWQRFDKWQKELGGQPNDSCTRFLANWVNVSYSLASYARNWTMNPVFLAGNNCYGNGNPLLLKAGDWIQWRLPSFAVHVLGITFVTDVKASSHLEILCAADCSEWHRVFSSKDHGDIKLGKKNACRCDFLVQRFKLRMLGGDDHTGGKYHDFVHFEGILQDI